MKNVFLDTNVILDYLLNREGYTEVMTILQWSSMNKIRLYCSVLTIADAYYVMRKAVGKESALKGISVLSSRISILPMNDMTLYSVVRNCGPDFEDSLQISCAETAHCDILITRNTKDFSSTNIPVYTPVSFVDACIQS